MCDCNDDIELKEPPKVGAIPCHMITVDLLLTYKNPVDCYIRYGLWSKVQSSKEELQAASNKLSDYISQKVDDPGACPDTGSLVIIQSIVSKIINEGVCL